MFVNEINHPPIMLFDSFGKDYALLAVRFQWSHPSLHLLPHILKGLAVALNIALPQMVVRIISTAPCGLNQNAASGIYFQCFFFDFAHISKYYFVFNSTKAKGVLELVDKLHFFTYFSVKICHDIYTTIAISNQEIIPSIDHVLPF